ncbi:acyltransferase family protein [Actinacidiphila soli]|uniref:acyltransferase family protein n=1 Tax=Actinacidiphila soli TaxID=2487275 RepID=UPI000FCA6116|nr:hypothetical protein [Actinacidiphila soli]
MQQRRTFLRPRSLQWAQWLGEVSFAFYLVQWPVLIYGHRLIGEQRQFAAPGAVGVMALLLAISMLLTWMLQVLVERLVMKRWSVSRARRPGTAAAPSENSPGNRPAQP